MIPGLHHYLIVSGLLFSLGLFGVLARRSLLVIFMSLELMLNAANLTFIAFARYGISPVPFGKAAKAASSMDGQMMVIFVMAVAAAEVAVGLGIIMAIFRLRKNVDLDELNLLKG